MNTKVTSILVLVCASLQFVHSYTFSQESVKSNIFESVRPKQPPKSISDCNKVITEPYGLLEKTYKRAEAKEGSSCTWTLRAPANHVVNIISVSYDLLDDSATEKHPNDYSGSFIDIYDGADSAEALLQRYATTSNQHVGGAFVQSISSKQQMVVRTTYHDNLAYATQKIAIKYEFLNVDDMKRLLQAH